MTTLETLFFTLLGVAFSGIGTLFLFLFKVNSEGTKASRDISERVAKLETADDNFQLAWKLLEAAVMKAMHSPTDHLGLDNLVDKYFNQHFDLAQGDWEWMHDRCEELLKEEQRKGDDRAGAKLGLFLSGHKLSQYGIVRNNGVNVIQETK